MIAAPTWGSLGIGGLQDKSGRRATVFYVVAETNKFESKQPVGIGRLLFLLVS
jgi:hypothetical protein